jgi:hypothetical protein
LFACREEVLAAEDQIMAAFQFGTLSLFLFASTAPKSKVFAMQQAPMLTEKDSHQPILASLNNFETYQLGTECEYTNCQKNMSPRYRLLLMLNLQALHDAQSNQAKGHSRTATKQHKGVHKAETIITQENIKLPGVTNKVRKDAAQGAASSM